MPSTTREADSACESTAAQVISLPSTKMYAQSADRFRRAIEACSYAVSQPRSRSGAILAQLITERDRFRESHERTMGDAMGRGDFREAEKGLSRYRADWSWEAATAERSNQLEARLAQAKEKARRENKERFAKAGLTPEELVARLRSFERQCDVWLRSQPVLYSDQPITNVEYQIGRTCRIHAEGYRQALLDPNFRRIVCALCREDRRRRADTANCLIADRVSCSP